jgi:outer membrane protein assembly factor BamB
MLLTSLVAVAALAGSTTSAVGANSVSLVQVWERAVDPESPEGSVATECVLADLTGDGTPELILATAGREPPWFVAALDATAGRDLWRVSCHSPPAIAVADLGGDGAEEVVVARGSELLVLGGTDGELLASAELASIVGEIDVGFLDADRSPDIVYTAGERKNDLVGAISGGDLIELWLRAAEDEDGRFANGFSHLCTADIDRNGLDDVLVAENMNVLVCLDSEGAERWRTVLGEKSRYVPEGVVSDEPVACDFTGDGKVEVAVACFAGSLLMLDSQTGEVMGRMQFGVESHRSFLRNRMLPRFVREALEKTGEPLFGLTPVELDGAPGSELVFGCSDGHLYAAAPPRGEVLWSHEVQENVYERSLRVDAGNGGPAMLLAWDATDVHLVSGSDGSAIAGFAVGCGASHVLASDFDADGFLDLLVVEAGTGRLRLMTSQMWAAPDRSPCE